MLAIGGVNGAIFNGSKRSVYQVAQFRSGGTGCETIMQVVEKQKAAEGTLDM